MKKLSIICTLMLTVLLATASKTKRQKSWQPDYRLEQSFINQFGNIENIGWEVVSEFLTSASFTDSAISYRPVKAFFDNEGQYVGMTQQTCIGNLPERLAEKVKKFIDSYTVIDMIEYWYDGSSAYYIKVFNKEGTRLVKASLSEGPKFVKAGE